MPRDLTADLLDGSFAVSVITLSGSLLYAAWSAIRLNGYPSEVTGAMVFGTVMFAASVICSEMKLRRDLQRQATRWDDD